MSGHHTTVEFTVTVTAAGSHGNAKINPAQNIVSAFHNVGIAIECLRISWLGHNDVRADEAPGRQVAVAAAPLVSAGVVAGAGLRKTPAPRSLSLLYAAFQT